MKIVYCIDFIDQIGGIERATISKANALSQLENYTVYIITADNRKEVPALSINSEVKVINLDIKYYEDYRQGFFSKYLTLLKKRRLHKNRLREKLNEIKPDIIISTGNSEKYFLTKFNFDFKPKLIREIHFVTHYRIISARSVLQKISAYIGEFIDYKYYIKKYDKIVVLTEEDRITNWKNNDKVIAIPNPLTQEPPKISELNNKVVITAGRLVAEKNFSSLINAWNIIHKQHPDWCLKIYGDGYLYQELNNQIKNLGLENHVYLEGATPNILEKMSEASIFVLTSITEGFGLVLIEAMSCGLPVVSYDCPCGPKDIINNNMNGFLIKLNDKNELKEKISYLIKYKNTRLKMGAEAYNRAIDFKIEKIIYKWISLFNNLN